MSMLLVQLLPVVPVAVLILLPCGFVKLAALILRSRLKWRHCFVFGIAVAAITILGRVAAAQVGGAASGVLSMLVAPAIYFLFGCLYFGSRLERGDGAPAGFQGGFRLMIAFIVLVLIFGGSTWALVSTLRGSIPA